MLFAVASRAALRTAAPAAKRQQQKRSMGLLDWSVNYPDKVMEMKKLQMKGGTCQGEVNPTWLKQPGDKLSAGFGLALVTYGGVLASIGFYRLATGKGKKD